MDATNGSSRHTATVPDQGSGQADARRPIGEIFVELGFISRADLQSALEVQRTTGGRIGEILVDQGSLTRIDLASALAEHWEPHAYAEDESLEDSLNGAARAAADQTAQQPEPGAASKPRRSRLRRSSAREDALEVEISRMSERLDALTHESLVRADHDRAVAERLLELSLRIDGLARDSDDRIAAIAADLRTEVTVASAGLDARLQAQTDEAAALQGRLAELQDNAASALAGAGETTAELHVEIGSLAGRLDELFGLRHADAQVARVANERMGGRVDDLIMRQADEAERRGAIVDESARAAERAMIEGLGALGKELIAETSKHGKSGKRLRRSIDALAEAIAVADARLAEQDADAEPEA